MIHIGPPPGLSRLRLQWHVTRSEFVRRRETVREKALRFVETARQQGHQTAARIRAAFRGKAMARQVAAFAAFEESYEKMADLVCWAAKEEDDARQAERYAKLRIALRLTYRPLRKDLRKHWAEAGTAAQADPFEALFVPDDIDIVINAVSGIESMMQTRCALEAYRSELESQLPHRRN